MSYQIRFTRGAKEDLLRLYRFQLERDLPTARRARNAIVKATEYLQHFSFSCRKPTADNPFLRELIIPFGTSGYVALFEIEDDKTVIILAVRQQREEDYY